MKQDAYKGALVNFLQFIHTAGEVLTAIAVLTGMAFALYFVYLLFQLSKQQGMMGLQSPPLALIMSFFAASALLKFGLTIRDLGETFSGDGTYPANNLPTLWSGADKFDSSSVSALQATLMVDLFALVGAIGVYRAFVMMPRIGNPTYGSQPASVGKMLAFMLGGIGMLRVADVAEFFGSMMPLLSAFADFLKQAV